MSNIRDKCKDTASAKWNQYHCPICFSDTSVCPSQYKKALDTEQSYKKDLVLGLECYACKQLVTVLPSERKFGSLGFNKKSGPKHFHCICNFCVYDKGSFDSHFGKRSGLCPILYVPKRVLRKNNDKSRKLTHLEEEKERVQAFCVCPITRETFNDPVVAKDGHTYEREDITRWLRKSKTSPITRERIDAELVPNNAMRGILGLPMDFVRNVTDNYNNPIGNLWINQDDNVSYQLTDDGEMFFF